MSAAAQALVFDPLAELRAEIEEVAQDGSLTVEERTAKLQEFRADLDELVGLIETYKGDNANEGAVPDEATWKHVLKLRENAVIREHLIETGKATPEVCDDLMLFEHAELDRLAEEGLLEETAMHVAGFMGAIGALGKFDEHKHPRGRGGKWIQTAGQIKGMKDGSRLDLGKGVSVKSEGRKYHVQQGGRTISSHLNHEHAAKSAHAAMDRPPGTKGAPGQRLQAPPKPPVAEKDLPAEQKTALYHERRTALEKRAAESVAKAAKTGKLSDAEAHFNDAGKVSQRTLANYVEEASTKPQTIDLYSSTNSNGERVWDESRRQLHERIITAFLKKRAVHPGTGKPMLDYSPDAPDLQPHPDGKQVLFSGGGYAAGKGGTLKILAARGETPPDAFTLDPDQIKAELPEFQAMIGTDPEANMHTYREAWAIAQEIQARAMDKGLNVVVDGISNTSPEEMGQRAKAFTDRGYAAKAVYVDIPTDEAMRRAAHRAETAKDDSDRRMIPETIMRAVHRDVAATVPALSDYLIEHDIPLDLSVWNNHQGKDENGQFRPPKQFYDFTGGQKQVIDQGLWDEFRRKGHETIAHVDQPSPRA